jgi:hypothetical protein
MTAPPAANVSRRQVGRGVVGLTVVAAGHHLEHRAGQLRLRPGV